MGVISLDAPARTVTGRRSGTGSATAGKWIRTLVCVAVVSFARRRFPATVVLSAAVRRQSLRAGLPKGKRSTSETGAAMAGLRCSKTRFWGREYRSGGRQQQGGWPNCASCFLRPECMMARGVAIGRSLATRASWLDDLTELIVVAVVVGVILGIVTLLGHGIWVLLSAIFGGKKSQRQTDASGAARTDEKRACPRCETLLSNWETSCEVCGWPAKGARTSGQAALRTVRAHVERLAQQGLVDAGARDKILDAVVVEERRVAAAEAAASMTAVQQHAPAAPAPAKAASAAPPTSPPIEELPPISDLSPELIEIPLTEIVAPPKPIPARTVPPAERARKYAASRQAAASEALAEPVAPAPVPPKRREATSRLLAAFMEEKNIRWGELVGGLLIIGCSIALVISFWSQIAERPLLKFGLFNGVTAALFGVGLYTDRRWKIHTTSHGILLIATLLVPLNFLAIAAFTEQTPPTDILSLGGEALSLAVFAALVFMAGQILVPADALLLVSGVMIPSLMQLLVRRFAEPAAPLHWLYLLAAVPIAVYLVSTSLAARRCNSDVASGLDETHAQRLLAFLGIVSFATFLPLALLGYKVPPLYGTLHRLSPLVVMCGLPAMLVGLLFRRRLADKRLSGLQTAGIAVGVLGRW